MRQLSPKAICELLNEGRVDRWWRLILLQPLVDGCIEEVKWRGGDLIDYEVALEAELLSGWTSQV